MVTRKTRINQRLRKYRADKIMRESSATSSGSLNVDNQSARQTLVKAAKEYDPEEVFAELMTVSKERKFLESIDAIIQLNVDPTRGDQMIRGTCTLPAGTGKEVKVCVFAGGDLHDELKAAGADILGNDQILLDIANDKIEFDKLLCSQEMIQDLKAYARILGPRGLMPNTKSGTLVKRDALVDQVRLSKRGLIEFRVNPESFILNKIGTRSFEGKALHENFDALMMALVAKKPESVKGRYFLKAMVKTSMGPPLRLNLDHYNQVVQSQSGL